MAVAVQSRPIAKSWVEEVQHRGDPEAAEAADWFTTPWLCFPKPSKEGLQWAGLPQGVTVPSLVVLSKALGCSAWLSHTPVFSSLTSAQRRHMVTY